MKKDDLMKIPPRQFGLPGSRKFPMQDEAHLKSAIAYFHTASKSDREELAENIIRRHGILKSNIRISSKNPLYKYVPDTLKSESIRNVRDPLVTAESVKELLPILDSDNRSMVESLMKKDGLEDVDDLDSAVPDEYGNKKKLLGTLKSFILNEDIDGKPYNYPIGYTDFPVVSEKLKRNNGGLYEMATFSVLHYDNTLNESFIINPVTNIDHVRFCTLLREWNELYITGHRDIIYDRLMIETWKSRVKILAKSHIDTPTPEKNQQFLDLGIDRSVLGSDEDMDSMIFDSRDKFEELELGDDIVPNTTTSTEDHTITVNSVSGGDGHMVQDGEEGGYDNEKYTREW